MQFSQLYTESIAEFLDAKQVLFINQKGLDALDDSFQHHLEEVKSLFLKEVESSRLLVTKDCQLFLPDNNNKESRCRRRCSCCFCATPKRIKLDRGLVEWEK